MTGHFQLVRPEALEEARFDPNLLESLIYGSGEGDEELDDDPGEALNIDKSWHGLHFLLTGTADEGCAPLDFILCGGAPLDLDTGLGPVRYFEPRSLTTVARAIATLDEKAMRSRYDAAKMQQLEIYPQIWREDDAVNYLIEHWSLLRPFLEKGAAEGFGLLVALT